MDSNSASFRQTELLNRARGGDAAARFRLLNGYRDRIRQLARVRLDERVSARVDASDVVQETLAEASEKIDDYFRDESVPLFVWLRQIAVERLVDVHRKHVLAQRRSVQREDPLLLSNASMRQLGDIFAGNVPSPSSIVHRDDLLLHVRQSLQQLPEPLREVLVMKYLEQLSTAEIAAAIEKSARTVQVRHLEAIKQLRALIEAGGP